MQHNAQIDGLETASLAFQPNNTSSHYKHQHCKCILTLVVNSNNQFKQETNEILWDDEEFFSIS